MPLVYTLEANYARGKNINHLKPRYDVQEDRLLEKEDSDVENSFSRLYGDMYEVIEMHGGVNPFHEVQFSQDTMTTDFEEQTMQYYRSKKSPAPMFTPEIWHDVGCSLLRAILDYDGINPQSRLVWSSDECQR